VAISLASRILFGFVAVGTGLFVATLGVVLAMTHSTTLRDALAEDWRAIRQRSGRDWAVVGVETLLSLGLAVRAAAHALAYLSSGLGGSPDVTLRLAWTPLTGRPAWQAVMARVLTALIGAWGVVMITPAWGWPPLVERALHVVLAANAVLLGDPLTAPFDPDIRPMIRNRSNRQEAQTDG
jgi:hypothetical protein